MKKDRLIHILKENWLLIVGGTLAILFVYSSFFLGNYQVSFTNVMYQMSPWNSLGVDTQGAAPFRCYGFLSSVSLL